MVGTMTVAGAMGAAVALAEKYGCVVSRAERRGRLVDMVVRVPTRSQEAFGFAWADGIFRFRPLK